jgi:hypothetical protein
LKGYDEPEILLSSTCPICLTGADAEQRQKIVEQSRQGFTTRLAATASSKKNSDRTRYGFISNRFGLMTSRILLSPKSPIGSRAMFICRSSAIALYSKLHSAMRLQCSIRHLDTLRISIWPPTHTWGSFGQKQRRRFLDRLRYWCEVMSSRNICVDSSRPLNPEPQRLA